MNPLPLFFYPAQLNTFEITSNDFKFCKCGAVAVDGGFDYLRRCGNLEDIEELSEVERG